MSSPRLSMAIVMIALTALTPMPSQSKTKTVQKDSPNARAVSLDCWSTASSAESAIPDCSQKKWSVVDSGFTPKGTKEQRCCSLMNTRCAIMAHHGDVCKTVYTKKARKEGREFVIKHCDEFLHVTWTERLCDTGSGPITDDTFKKCPQYQKYLDGCKDIDVTVGPDTEPESDGIVITVDGLPLRHLASALLVVSTLIVSFLVLL